MTEDISTPPSRALARRLRSLIANLDTTSVESTAKQVCEWIDSFKDQDDDRFRGLLRLSAELILEKAMERSNKDFHRVLGRFCKVLDTATGGETSGFLNSLWKQEINAAGVELAANDAAGPGSWPECLALVVFAGELCDQALLQPDALRSCTSMLTGLGSNLGLELACTLLEATGNTFHRDHDGKQRFGTAIQAMRLASRGNGISARIRHRVKKLATRWTAGPAPPDDVQWDDETVDADADEEPRAKETVPQFCKPKHPKLYFRSGDVVFVCEDTSFRVQSDLLSNNSQVLSDMLEQARLNTNGDHLSDGCPCVHLTDAAEDFATLLKVFYTPGFLHRRKAPNFTTFSSLLRMTTKYKFQEIRFQILLDLLSAYPTQLTEPKTSSLRGEAVFGSPIPHPNSVLDLFVKCRVAFALPFAYYRVSIAGDPASLNTSSKENALPPDTLKAALRGQAQLKAEEVQLAKRIALQSCRSWVCSGDTPANRVPVFDWILPKEATQSGILERGKFEGSGFCSQCSQTFTEELAKAKKETWKKLPSYFGLPSWESASEKSGF